MEFIWQPADTVPKEKDKILLIKTKIGIVSGEYFPGEMESNYFDGDEWSPPVFSCYNDNVVIESDVKEDGSEYFPEILGWMYLPNDVDK